MPVEAEPLGWDSRSGYRKHYPRVNLPTQIVERVSFGRQDKHEPNRLIWGDNLHVMRQMPSNSVDLIYIDPPFFSGRQYNVMWGDSNEMRSFNDIWEGGMPGYLVWLNARLYEMKRILKSTGSIYVHCDWHASHYIKVEMDKIFGYQNFRNEIVWHYGLGGSSPRIYSKKHDVLFYYTLSNKYYFDKPQEPAKSMRMRGQMKGVSDVWDIPSINNMAKERIGYPTQKPEPLLERVIQASSEPDDIILDAFIGGGTTAAVTQRLGRRWIAIDQSRVAIAVTTERLKQGVASAQFSTDVAPPPPSPHTSDEVPDFTVEQWGIYEAQKLSSMPSDDFQQFVLRSYGVTRLNDGDDGPHIHAWPINGQYGWVNRD